MNLLHKLIDEVSADGSTDLIWFIQAITRSELLDQTGDTVKLRWNKTSPVISAVVEGKPDYSSSAIEIHKPKGLSDTVSYPRSCICRIAFDNSDGFEQDLTVVFEMDLALYSALRRLRDYHSAITTLAQDLTSLDLLKSRLRALISGNKLRVEYKDPQGNNLLMQITTTRKQKRTRVKLEVIE